MAVAFIFLLCAYGQLSVFPFISSFLGGGGGRKVFCSQGWPQTHCVAKDILELSCFHLTSAGDAPSDL